MSARMPLGVWTQKPQKYHARSLAELRKKYAAVADKARLDPILERAGCLRWLAARGVIDLYYWPTPNGWKISIALEEMGAARIA